jgi:hypothetical protein
MSAPIEIPNGSTMNVNDGKVTFTPPVVVEKPISNIIEDYVNINMYLNLKNKDRGEILRFFENNVALFYLKKKNENDIIYLGKYLKYEISSQFDGSETYLSFEKGPIIGVFEMINNDKIILQKRPEVGGKSNTKRRRNKRKRNKRRRTHKK